MCDDDTIDEAVVDIQLPTDKAEAWKKEEKAVFQREAAVSAASLGDELSSLGDRMIGRPPRIFEAQSSLTTSIFQTLRPYVAA